MSTHFEIFTDTKGKYRFRLCSGSKRILSSEGYASKASCKKGLASVKKNAASTKNFVDKKSSKGDFYFQLRAQNHRIIGQSDIFTSKDALESAKAEVRKAKSAKVKYR